MSDAIKNGLGITAAVTSVLGMCYSIKCVVHCVNDDIDAAEKAQDTANNFYWAAIAAGIGYLVVNANSN